ncbi:MAG: hypothetical protein GWN84_13250 [Gammaproteobacteria bacterium]|nr:hypothetical protein [Gammaproteobacteria bacterium]NIR83796.1 hypothetical protein [Gammaproteobacteria bacterium]NIU05122.1 hypothetical protein [Gammaproteobacteria bacterium]NIV51959.1 hypothetical protein [Gammaproteobacteria bacterium]NIX86395.1 hypothetical protein [Gammaproteobacteria bacterium]
MTAASVVPHMALVYRVVVKDTERAVDRDFRAYGARHGGERVWVLLCELWEQDGARSTLLERRPLVHDNPVDAFNPGLSSMLGDLMDEWGVFRGASDA